MPTQSTLAVGAAFALGGAALGSLLAIAFNPYNITDGIKLAAPLVPNRLNSEDQVFAPLSEWAFGRFQFL